MNTPQKLNQKDSPLSTNNVLDLIVSQAPTDLGNFVTVVSRFAGTIKGAPPGFDEIPFFPGIPVESRHFQLAVFARDEKGAQLTPEGGLHV